MGYAFFNTYGLPVITTFTMNNFGERQHTDKFIPIIVRNILNGEKIPIHCKLDGDGQPTEIGQRTWLHCRNTASALLFLVEHGVAGEFYNIIGFDEYYNSELALLIGRIMDRDVELNFVDFHKTRPGHDRRYSLCGEKLKNMGWKPPVEFKASLHKTIEWYMQNLRWLSL